MRVATRKPFRAAKIGPMLSTMGYSGSEQPRYLPRGLNKRFIEHLAKTCGFVVTRTHIGVPKRQGDTDLVCYTLGGSVLSFAKTIEARARGCCRHRVVDEFTFVAEHSAFADARFQAQIILDWLNKEAK